MKVSRVLRDAARRMQVIADADEVRH